ncbi:MAG: hypothetical protein IKK39_12190 [Thermoguttaceae bacterium]|nr:hypothetical protein [Thermoguttaceae bacterium]MBR4104804.1 hypothetical protein [Thermoguttaceae bacterium]
MSETALKIFNALLAGKTVATRGVIVDAVRVKNGRLLCLSISENGRANEVDATDAEVVVLTKTETLKPATTA